MTVFSRECPHTWKTSRLEDMSWTAPNSESFGSPRRYGRLTSPSPNPYWQLSRFWTSPSPISLLHPPGASWSRCRALHQRGSSKAADPHLQTSRAWASARCSGAELAPARRRGVEARAPLFGVRSGFWCTETADKKHASWVSAEMALRVGSGSVL